MTSSESPTNARARLEPALATLRANSEEADRSASLPAENIQALRAAGAMRWSLPRALGGDELSSVEKVDLWSAMGAADLCTVWIFANYDSQLWDVSSRANELFPDAFALLRSETAFLSLIHI